MFEYPLCWGEAASGSGNGGKPNPDPPGGRLMPLWGSTTDRVPRILPTASVTGR